MTGFNISETEKTFNLNNTKTSITPSCDGLHTVYINTIFIANVFPSMYVLLPFHNFWPLSQPNHTQ